MKTFNFKFTILIAIHLLFGNYVFAQTADIQRISSEQKAYELSVVWKELSYNFANMDNCPDVNLDSLYCAYIPIVTDTKNDFEYILAMQKFLSNFNNGHVYCQNPNYLNNYAAFLLFTTRNENGKVFVDKVCKIYSNLQKDDEILSINNLSISEYIDKFLMPYTFASNMNAKKQQAKIGFGGMPALNSDNEKLFLTIKRKKNIEKVEVPFICYTDYQSDTIKYQQIIDFYNKDLQSTQENIFIVDKKNDFAYIKLSACYADFHNFFVEKYDDILQYKNLIVDVSNNGGGSNNYTSIAERCLVNLDSIRYISYKTRINNAWKKSKATSRIYYYKDDEVTQEEKDEYYPFFYNNAFEDVGNSSALYLNEISDTIRYKGNIFVIVNGTTVSAAEYFVAMLAQSPKVKILGEQTSGGLAQPLVTVLPSGMRVFINSSKTFDTKGNDISSGIKPDYEYDFSNIYNIKNPQDRLKKIIAVIKSFEIKK